MPYNACIDFLNDKLKCRENLLNVIIIYAEQIFQPVSALYSRISPGWHCSILQIASNVSKRIPLALPVFSMDKLAGVMSNFSARSLLCILRLASITSMLTTIGMAK